MGEQFQSEAEVYGALSEFYTALWEHLDVLSEGSRWLRASAIMPTEQREARLREQFDSIKSMPLERSLRKSLEDQLHKTMSLCREFEKEAPDDSLRGEVEDWKVTLQELSLESARLEVVNTQGR